MAQPLAQSKPMPLHVTLLLVNNFLINTTNFLNQFSETVEKKIGGISSKVTELEILLAVLEAKLNSIPGLGYSSSDLPATAPAPAAPTTAPAPPSSSSSSSAAAAPPSQQPSQQAAGAVEETKAAGVAAKDHPDYAGFFKMLRVGVPQPVVAGKVSAAGLNPSLLDTPDAIIDEGGSSQALTTTTIAASSPAVVASAPPPPPPPPPQLTQTSTAAEPHEQAPASAPPAPAADENPQYEIYRKMKRMLPEGPVRQKMSNDGCTEEEIDRFFAS